MNVTFTQLPATLAQLKAQPDGWRKKPETVAALTVCALAAYPADKEESIAMLNELKGPQALSAYDKQFLADRFRDKDYVPRSYFAGAAPENGYTPSEPYTITVSENAYSRSELKQGYLTLWLKSSGADSPRQVKLRTKASTGEWFLWEQMLLADIRKPAAQDPWA